MSILELNFQLAIRELLDDERGYSHDPNDPGGETKYGISKRSYPHLDIASLTPLQATQIYYDDWWLKYEFDKLPARLGHKVFNIAVNTGAHEAVLCLQQAFRAVGFTSVEDGAIGPLVRGICETIEKAGHGEALLAAFRSEAAGYYRTLNAVNGRDKEFIKGWLNRAYR